VNAPLVGDELASIIILCCNQLDYTRQCLESVLAHTRAPYELILVDNGSSDGTGEYLHQLAVSDQRSAVRIVVIGNETNRGFAVGCNQGLAAARGQYLILLNNDTIVTPGWLEGLIALSLADWPKMGMVGPVTSMAAGPQQIPVDYRSLDDLNAFAARRRREFAGKALEVERLIGFCLLIRRDVLQAVGSTLDERFGLGFFEDDDLCFRAREKGFRLAVALDVFIHHFGNRTFTGLGLDAHQMLKENFERFQAKWGTERTAGYRLPEGAVSGQQSAASQKKGVSGQPSGVTQKKALSGQPSAVSQKNQVCVSLCMIVKNGEAGLGACLASLRGLVDEIVVVDTGSTDRTKEIAAEHGAHVVDFAWQDSFAAARNESLRHATGEWILWLDADERLDQANRERLRILLGNLVAASAKDAGGGGSPAFLANAATENANGATENVAYVMRQRSPLEAATHGIARVDQVRLFRNLPGLSWRYRVHEQILLSLRELGAQVRETDIVITHDGFSDPAIQGAKVERNLRLLRMENEENPNDAFVLYNLGAVLLTQNQPEEGLTYLRRSLELSHPRDNLVPKLHSLVTRGRHQAGQKDGALAACRAGRLEYPDDAELLFWEAMLLRDKADLAGAEACLLRVLEAPRKMNFTSMDSGMQGFRARHFLAEVYREQKRLAEAEAQWRAVLAECPGFSAAWRNLAEMFLELGRWAELEQACARLAEDTQDAVNGRILQARGHLARKEFVAAREILQEIIIQDPKSLWPHVLLSHVLLQEGTDWVAAERALRDILDIDPNFAEAKRNLEVLEQVRSPKPDQTPGSQTPFGNPPAGNSVSRVVGVAKQTFEDGRSQTEFGNEGYGAGRARNVNGVSLCMIVKDEEANLPACLASVGDLAGEIIVVDTGSTDGTREVAERLGAKVLEFPWVDSFAAARNETLRHATGEWIFWMDADDRLDEANREKLRALFAGLKEENAGFVMKCLCLPDPVTKATTQVDHLRLFRNLPELSWRYRVHEQILPAIRERGADVRWCDVVIHHTGYRDPALRARKLERDLRLLLLDQAEHPDDPFILFNLGCIYQEQGRQTDALPLLRRSLERSQPADSIVRKLYTLIAQCHNQLGERNEALSVCHAGRTHFADDPELLFQEGICLRHLGDLSGAKRCWEQVLSAPPGPYFASFNTGIRGYLTRHNLAAVSHDLGLIAEAEAHWRAVLTERPDYEAAWIGLGDIFLAQERWQDVEEAARHLEASDNTEGPLLGGRVLLARKDFARAQATFSTLAERHPRDIRPRQLLSHAYLQEGRDWQAAEKTLRTILDLDPNHPEAQQNLKLLLCLHGGKGFRTVA
jgi:glycosyltransferase involved in cell wall biosynthesis/Flp pilus assembly protein TadD